LRKNFFYR